MKTHRIAFAQKSLTAHMEKRIAAAPVALRAERIPAIAALLGNAAWWMPAAGRNALADLGLAIYAFDDVVDESDIPVRDLQLRAEQLAACARGDWCPEVAFDPTAGLLRAVAERLATAPLGAALWADWCHASAACFRGMVEHREAAEGLAVGLAPTVEEYLALGGDSMGVVAASLVATMVDADERVLAAKDVFIGAAKHAAIAARIANDLRTIDREKEEGTINALLLPGVTRTMLIARMCRERAEAERLLKAAGGCGFAGRFVLAFVDGILAIYARSDFHDADFREAS